MNCSFFSNLCYFIMRLADSAASIQAEELKAGSEQANGAGFQNQVTAPGFELHSLQMWRVPVYAHPADHLAICRLQVASCRASIAMLARHA